MSRLPHQQIEPTAPQLTGDERRRCPRRLVEELATAVFHADREHFGLLRVLVVDTSHTGIGLKAEQYVEPGTRMTLTQNNLPMPHKSGTVVRCTADAKGHFLVGVRCDKPKSF